MIETNSILEGPSNPNSLVWRYMDVSKLVALLQDKALYFARADSFEDPFEGSLPRRVREEYEHNAVARAGVGSLTKEDLLKSWIDTHRQLLQQVYISCWHMSEHESAALWSIYGKSNDAVCIQTTYAKLAALLPSQVEAGLVTYIDYDTETFRITNNLNSPFIHKRMSFEHDKEVRALILPSFMGFPPNLPVGAQFADGGVKVLVDLVALIDHIFVSPTSKPWFERMIRSLVQTYGITASVTQSSLARAPLW